MSDCLTYALCEILYYASNKKGISNRASRLKRDGAIDLIGKKQKNILCDLNILVCYLLISFFAFLGEMSKDHYIVAQ